MIILFQISFAIAVCLAIYWALVRPLLLDSVSTSLAAMNAEMDWAGIEDREGARTKAGVMFAHELCAVSHESAISSSLSILLHELSAKGKEIRRELIQEEEIFAEAPAWMQKMRREMDSLVMRRLVINSPTWWLPVAFLLFLGVFSWKAKDAWAHMVSLANHIVSAADGDRKQPC